MKQQILKTKKLAAFKAMLITLFMFVWESAGLFAQQGTVAAGGVATGAGGTASYSTGLVSYITATGSGGIINQGLQQAASGKFIPGRIEAESWDVKNGPQYPIPSTDAGGGQQVVGITNGSWMDYNVTVTQSGIYTVNFRVATTQNNAQFQVKLGATVLGTINIPNTGGWSNWQTVSVTNILLTAGVQTIRIQSTNNETCNFNWTEWALTTVPVKFIPGRIEAEDFDVKDGPQYAIPSTDIGGGQQMVGITNGSWMDYNVTVLTTGLYKVDFRVATTQNNAQFQVKLGATVLGTINIPNTGGWSTWQTVTLNNISLTAGVQTIRIQSTNNESCNFNWTDWSLQNVCNQVQGESFFAKAGGQYAVATDDPAGGVQHIAGFINGGWLDYNVPSLTTGTYTVNFRVATPQNSVQLQVYSGGILKGTKSITNTGGWSNWQTQSVSGIALTAGQPIRIQVIANGNEGCNFNWFELCSGAVPTSAEVITQAAPVQKNITANKLVVSVFPNPTNDYFNLRVQSKSIDQLSIKVVDMAGRQVQQLQGIPGQALRFGENMKSGTYFIEVRQGSEKVVTKVIKQ